VAVTTQTSTLATIPTATVIATKSINSEETQRILAYPEIVTVVDASSGLTTASTSYTAGDQVGAIQNISSVFRTGALYGYIVGAVLSDEGDVVPTTAGYDIYFWSASVTLASDNAAGPAVSDSDMRLLRAKIEMPAFRDEGANRTSTWWGSVPVASADTSLYYSYVTRGDHSFFAATSDLYLILHVQQG
jgi:hypothetical protein